MGREKMICLPPSWQGEVPMEPSRGLGAGLNEQASPHPDSFRVWKLKGEDVPGSWAEKTGPVKRKKRREKPEEPSLKREERSQKRQPTRRCCQEEKKKEIIKRRIHFQKAESGRGVARPEGEQAEQAEPRQGRDGSPAPTVIQPPEGDERGTGADSAVTTAPGPVLVPTQAQISIAEPQPENEASTAICRPTEAGVPARVTTTVIPETPGSSQTSIQRGALDGPSTSSDGAVQTVGTRRGRSAGADARPSLEGWNDETALGITMALAPSSRRSYTRAIQEFLDFRQYYKLPEIMPVPHEHIAQFCVYHKRRGLTPRTIRTKLAALAYWFKSQGLNDPTDDFRIHKILTGWARHSGHPKDDRQPLTPAILKGLKQIWPRICTSPYEQALFHAAALTAFFAALRVSELVSMAKTDTSHRALLVSDVMFFQEKIDIRIRMSKTDQGSKGQIVSLQRCGDDDLCPVQAMRQFATLRGSEGTYLFCHQDGTPLTKYQFWSVTSRALDTLGMGHLKFGTHSFRIGAASAAAAMGYDKEAVKAVGRWRSNAFKGYIRPCSI
ncbi:uncharacterized protein [Anolis sagrei]|uniref:uncharacterized protein isoform X2 n=1 Tax=Anolis sagrei TaxID=38937 RepID=UPI0035229A57